MFVLISITLIVLAGIALNYSVEVSYYDSFKRRIENGFRNWGLVENPTEKDVLDYFSDPNVIYLTFGITEYRTFTIINNKNNQVLFSNKTISNNEPSKLLDEFFSSENYLNALAGGVGDKSSFLRLGDKVYFDYAIRKGDFLFYFRYDREDWKSTIDEFNQVIQFSLMLAVIISIVLGYFLSRTITNPIVDLMHQTRRIALGDFGKVLQVKGDDEIGKLTNAFNYMSRKLKNTVEEIFREKRKVETILENLTDGVVAFNHEGGMIHINEIAKKLLNMQEKNITFDEFSIRFKMGTTFHQMKGSEINVKKSIDIIIEDRIIKTYFAFFTDELKRAEGFILVLRDVTEEKKLENLQREFVANVSHELKTPLASIKSYTETMIDGVDPDTRERFLKIVNKETDRMTRIVKDLLQLSKIDNQRLDWNMQTVDIHQVLLECIEKLSRNFEEKQLVLNKDFWEGPLWVQGDPFKLEQVIINILTNAIKYTPHLGQVTLSSGKLDTSVFVRIMDTGVGIPLESLPRIFDRFYRVDKARARENGGTGLGLSIAKEIIELHGGSISANSQPGKGTEMMMMIPESRVELNEIKEFC